MSDRPPPVKTATEARQGRTIGVVRWARCFTQRRTMYGECGMGFLLRCQAERALSHLPTPWASPIAMQRLTRELISRDCQELSQDQSAGNCRGTVD
jgi:hypothetical protein